MVKKKLTNIRAEEKRDTNNVKEKRDGEKQNGREVYKLD